MSGLPDSIKASGYQVKTIDFSNTAIIDQKGLYYLDDACYIILIPDYLKDTNLTCDDVINTCRPLNYMIKQHKNGTHESRATHYIGPSYTYSDITHDTNNTWPASLLKLKAKCESEFLCPLNSALVNRYDKNQHIPFHQDDEECLQTHKTILSYSVGETRNISFKSVDTPSQQVQFKLKPNTLLIMGGEINKKWLHSVPKGNYKSQRFNITFRFIDNKSPNTPASTSLDRLFDEIEKLRIKIENYESKILNLHEKTQIKKDDTSKGNHIHTNDNKKIVVFDKNIAPNRYSCAEHFNKHLDEKNKISVYDIAQISDHRQKNGPLIVDFSHMTTKIKLLKIKSKELPISDCLSKIQIKLKKDAKKLKDEKKISAYWVFRGEVFYSLPNSEERIPADSDAFLKLRNTEESPSLTLGNE